MDQIGVAMYLKKPGNCMAAPVSVAIRDEHITIYALDEVSGESVAQATVTIEGDHVVVKAMPEANSNKLTTDVQPVIIRLHEIESIPF